MSVVRPRLQLAEHAADLGVTVAVADALWSPSTGGGTHYVDLGLDHFDKLDRQVAARRSVGRLEKRSYQVSI